MSKLSALYNRFREYFSGRWPAVYSFCDKRKGIIKFVIAGCFAGGTDLVLLFIFHGLVHLDIVLSTSLAFILSFLISFSLQKLWTFRNYRQGKMMYQLSLYILNAFLGLYLNGSFMHLLVNQYQVWYILAQIMVNLALAAWNFVVYKFIVFKHDNHEVNR
jgi:putative flippase GtrA